jgi:ribonucleoside-diphosphate reductase alpha chain
MLKIVNQCVPLALKKLNYSEDKIKEILNYIEKNETIEGAPHLLEEHLPVFDCAFKPAKGERSIHYLGHIKMMGAIQPFISGAISKTINMPEDSSVEDIANAYLASWKHGLKAVAIYRENSKRSQPLNTQKTEGEMVKKEPVVKRVERIKLPQTRKSLTHKFEISGHEGYITVGLYDNGKPGEVFVTMHKQGSTIRGLMDAWATSVSLNLQYGVPVNYLFGRFRHQKFEPAGFVKNIGGGAIDEKISQIRTASSIVDYVSQFMLNNFGEGSGKVEFKISDLEATKEGEEQASLEEFESQGIICQICGGPAKRIGNCEVMCTSCKQVTRSGCGE